MNLIQPEVSITKWNKKLARQIIKHYCNQCRLVVSPSQKIKHTLQDLGVESEITVISTGVDASLFQPAPAFLRSMYHLDGKQVIIFVGRVRPEKNIELLIDAFALLAPKYPEAMLVIAGSGKHAEALMHQVQRLNLNHRTIFTGGLTRDQVYQALTEADVFCFPSVTETQGLVIDEAVLAGLPVVMVDHEVSEVAQDGHNALFAKNQPADYASQIGALLQDPARRQQLAQQSLQISSQFKAVRQAEKLAECYQQILAEPRPSADAEE